MNLADVLVALWMLAVLGTPLLGVEAAVQGMEQSAIVQMALHQTLQNAAERSIGEEGQVDSGVLDANGCTVERERTGDTTHLVATCGAAGAELWIPS